VRDRDEISLDHLDLMTDSTGLIQHAIYGVPRRESGYTTDDNARALRLCARIWNRQPSDRLLARVACYLSFMEFARTARGGVHNFMSYQREWLDAQGCGDCHGQAVRSLAEVLGSNLPHDYQLLARELIEALLPALADLRSIRAQAYVILAFGHLWTSGVPDIEPLENVAWSAAQRLMESYRRAVRPKWRWFESRMTYANAVLPHALFVAAQRWPTEPYLDIAKAAFDFLDEATTAEAGPSVRSNFTNAEEGVFSPIGSNGWHPHGETKALYDQQPVEAATMAEAAIAAHGLLGDEKYLATFRRSRDWFYGRNTLGVSLVDPQRGGCFDGLSQAGVNRNQGAESTLSYLWAELQHLEIQRAAGNGYSAAASA
jgi:hypothetical protein